MRAKITILLIILVSAGLFAGLIGLATTVRNKKPRVDYSEFISCLSENDVRFYGASWCPHCRNQKALFGDQKNQLDEKGVYIECSPDGTSAQIQQCVDAGIESYPTWDIKGQRMTGELELGTLAALTACELPQEPE